jgi:hypothetical protein
MRSKPKILVALPLAALTAIALTKGITAEWKLNGRSHHERHR